LLYGIDRSNQKADADHPFGYGSEIDFWSFVVSLLIFALGAGFAIFAGVGRILTPVPIESPVVSYGADLWLGSGWTAHRLVCQRRDIIQQFADPRLPNPFRKAAGRLPEMP
jgi:divalent metal cation (Fe/Co/Zn/Cd) transporter